MAIFGAIASVVAAPAVHAEEPLVLKPIGRWLVDYADDSCALRRTFGSEAEPFWLEIRQYAPGDEFIATVASRTVNLGKLAPDLRYRFVPDGEVRKNNLVATTSYAEGSQGVVLLDSMRPESSFRSGDELAGWSDEARDERERALKGLHIELTGSPDFELETGELHEPMNAMRTCLDDLIQSWGMDPQIHRSLSQKAGLENASAVTYELSRKVPSSLVPKGTTVMFRIIISEAGETESCNVILPAIEEGPEKDICELIRKRAVFTPARDASGNPVRSPEVFSVAYAISYR